MADQIPGINWDEAGTGYRSGGGANPLRTAADIAMGGGGQQKTRYPISAKPQPQATPASPFADYGLGKYINRNANGIQFNKPAIRGAVEKGLDNYMMARYYRHAGLMAGVRGALGMPPVPSHVNDWIKARHNMNVVGQNPDAAEHEHWGL